MKKKNLIIFTVILLGLLALTFYSKALSTSTFGNVNISGDLNVTGLFNATGPVDLELNWTMLQNYPQACPTGSYLTALNDTVTCTAITNVPDNVTFADSINVTEDLEAGGVLFVDGRYGYVGIGTSNPQQRLTVGDGTGPEFIEVDGAFVNTAGFKIRKGGSNEWGIMQDGSVADLGFYSYNDGGYVMTLTYGGKVGIGTIGPTDTLNVNGTLNITGMSIFEQDVNVTGNLTAENVWIPTYFFAHTNNVIDVVTAGDWYNISFDDEEAIKQGITHDYTTVNNDTVTIIDTGVYSLSYTVSFEDSDSSPSAHIATRLTANNDEISGSLLESDSFKQNADMITSHQRILARFNSGDLIRLQFAASATTVSLNSHATYGDHKDTATWSMVRVN